VPTGRRPTTPTCESDGDEPPTSPATDAPSTSRHSLQPAHLAVVVLVTAAALVGTVLVLASAQPATEQVTTTASPTPTPASTGADSAATSASSTADGAMAVAPAAVAQAGPPAEVVVHVAGKVRRPGVVRLPAGSRVIDAVEAAGGALPRARLATVNLARVLSDGEQVLVGRAATAPQPETTGTDSAAPGASGAPVDLNNASLAELEGLPGVGPVLAARIVAYRDESGPFRSVDQLIEVPGIGPAVLSGLADRARV